jgi:hypothetical protein
LRVIIKKKLTKKVNERKRGIEKDRERKKNINQEKRNRFLIKLIGFIYRQKKSRSTFISILVRIRAPGE